LDYKYRHTVLVQLEGHGARPSTDTPPELVHDFVSDLYRYEIRALKRELKQGRIPQADYASRVDKLRMRYPVLSLPLRYWTE
jgi:hypothetical protein